MDVTPAASPALAGPAPDLRDRSAAHSTAAEAAAAPAAALAPPVAVAPVPQTSPPRPPPSTASVLADYAPRIRRRVLMGTCGWNDATIGQCGRFYPGYVKNATERLRHYATHFPCVEVDTSNYAIPHLDRVREWMAQVPPTFKFHFKIFGMVTAGAAEYNAIPGSIRHLLDPAMKEKAERSGVRVKLKDTPQAFKDALWGLWNALMRMVAAQGKLGLCVFQFHLGFGPTEENKSYIRWCREQLDPCAEMGIEFRSRSWFTKPKDDTSDLKDEDFIRKTVHFARSINCALIAEDDLAHEVIGRFVPLAAGEKVVHLPIHLHVAAPHSIYIRLHRRQGNKRVLADWEFAEWAERFARTRDQEAEIELEGPMWFLWGTDWEDQPVINSKKMMAALQEFDARKQKEYEERMAAGAEAASVPTSAAVGEDAPLPPRPPEPLAFDYPRYYRQVLSRLPSAPQGSTSAQQSLGAFFGAQASKPKDKPPPASKPADPGPPASLNLPPPGQAFVRASALPLSPVSPSSSIAAAVKLMASSGPAAAASKPAKDTTMADSDVAAEVAAIERAHELAQPADSASGKLLSPGKRKVAPDAAKESPAKKAKAQTKGPAGVPSVASFFKRV